MCVCVRVRSLCIVLLFDNFHPFVETDRLFRAILFPVLLNLMF